MNYTQSDSGRSSFAPTEKRDCTVRAVAACFGITYQEAHDKLSTLGRKQKRGCKFHRMIDALGLEQRPDLCSMTLTKALHMMQQGRFVVQKANHVFAVIDGTVIDMQAPKDGTRVRMVYQKAL